MIASPDLHRFLREAEEAMYGDGESFEIEPLHDHCRVVAARDDFENILASAAGDHLGAYSRELRSAHSDEKQKIGDLFESVDHYCPYQLLPGNIPGCSECRERNNHLFTTWFYGVAWDWCLFATWPTRALFWIGCLTDAD